MISKYYFFTVYFWTILTLLPCPDATALPLIGIRINDGAKFTNSYQLNVEIRSMKLSLEELQSMRCGLNPDLSDAKWVPYSGQKVRLTIPAKDGEVLVYAQLKDKAGNESKIESNKIILDTEAPVINALAINQDAKYTNDKLGRVIVQLKATGADKVRASNSIENLENAKWQSTSEQIKWQLDLQSGDGEKIVYVQAGDFAGNSSKVTRASIILDTTPPSEGELIINDGEKYTRNSTLNLRFRAKDAHLVRVVSKNKAENLEYKPDNSGWMTFPWKVDTMQGKKEVRIFYMDIAKNKAANYAADEVIYDTKGPAIPQLTINDGEKFTNHKEGLVQVKIQAKENPSGLKMIISNKNPNEGKNPQDFSRSVNWKLENQEDGLKTIYAKIFDEAGNGSAVASREIILDRKAPVISAFKINDESEWTTSNKVNLSFEVEGADFMQISNTNQFSNYTPWEKFEPVRQGWLLAANNNPASIYVRFKDEAGNITEVSSASIRLDTKIPKGQISINDGKKFSNHPEGLVTVKILADPDVMGMQISNTPEFQENKLLPIDKPLEGWKLGDGEGLKTIYVRFKDKAGNYSEVTTARIMVDRTPPGDCSVVINNGDEWTTNKAKKVAMSLAATDASAMMISNEPSFANKTWIPYKSAISWTLSGDEGENTVFVRFKDAAGNETVSYSDNIKLDVTPPAVKKFKIENELLYINDPQKNVTIYMQVEGATDMALSNEPSMDISNPEFAWEAYKSESEWILSNEDGLKTVYAVFKDPAGNLTPLVNDKIYLDRIPPEDLTLAINNSEKVTNEKEGKVTLYINAKGASEMMISNTADFVDAKWISFRNVVNDWKLNTLNGEAIVYIKCRDQALNETEVQEARIIIDTTPPEFPAISINSGDKFVKDPTKPLYLELSANQADKMRIGNNAKLTGTSWEPYSSDKEFLMSAGDGIKYVHAIYSDEAGNISSMVYDSIIFDTTPPKVEKFVIDDGKEYTNAVDKNVSIEIVAKDAVEIRLCNNPEFNDCKWKVFPNKAMQHELQGEDGDKIVYAQLRDEAGNTTNTLTESIKLKRSF